ncbi:MAG: hypothetical protein M1824_004329 [Vezdaea acicularis]|nr:MAG: hypothetical protein M1824_004329 [Vezdaea acicularis]
MAAITARGISPSSPSPLSSPVSARLQVSSIDGRSPTSTQIPDSAETAAHNKTSSLGAPPSSSSIQVSATAPCRSPAPPTPTRSDKPNLNSATAGAGYPRKTKAKPGLHLPLPPTTNTFPINIPQTVKNYGTPTTPTSPLTARITEKEGRYFPFYSPSRHTPHHNRKPSGKTQYYSTALRETPHSPKRMYTERSPTYAPSSSLSPTYSASMPPPSGASRRQNRNTAHKATLKLSGLPRFHPANFSNQATMAPAPAPAPQPQYSDVQLQLHLHQRELISSATRSSADTTSTGSANPVSPRLCPLGSPGPVTPIVLDERGGYLVAGAAAEDRKKLTQTPDGEQALVERLIREETTRASGRR